MPGYMGQAAEQAAEGPAVEGPTSSCHVAALAASARDVVHWCNVLSYSSEHMYRIGMRHMQCMTAYCYSIVVLIPVKFQCSHCLLCVSDTSGTYVQPPFQWSPLCTSTQH